MELTIEQALQQGIAAQKEGNLQEAERLYRAILQSQPHHSDANHNLGLIAVSVDNVAAALPLFKTAIEANPKKEEFWLSYIDALIKGENFDNAKKVLEHLKKRGLTGEKVDALEEQIPSLTTTANINSATPSPELLSSLVEYYRNQQFSEAEKLAISITQEFPEHEFSWQILGAILIVTGRFSEAIKPNQMAVQLAPQDAAARSNLGNALKQLGRLEEAEASYIKAIALKPDFAEAHSNLGNTLKELGKLEEAEASCKQAIALKPDFAEAHSNLGNSLKELGRLKEAEVSYKQAIALKSDFAQAHNNLGNTLTELGRFEEAEASYTKAIALKPDFAEAHQSLIALLTVYSSQKENSLPSVKADQEIKDINLEEKTARPLSNAEIVKLCYESSSILKKHGLKFKTHLSQTYRRNPVDLNCKRHKKIFNTLNVIPKFCFGCYKVQVEPRTILELIKLFVVFDQIKLVENNTRKCMVELRPEIAGFYKGLIYCSSLQKALEISDYLEMIMKRNISPDLQATVKRGCSEYPIVFPAYKEINKSGDQPMEYNKDWKRIEEDYDSKNPKNLISNVNPSLSGFSLSDVLIIRNWIDYAKGIGDSSVNLLNENTVYSRAIYDVAKARLEKHPWQERL